MARVYLLDVLREEEDREGVVSGVVELEHPAERVNTAAVQSSRSCGWKRMSAWYCRGVGGWVLALGGLGEKGERAVKGRTLAKTQSDARKSEYSLDVDPSTTGDTGEALEGLDVSKVRGITTRKPV